MLQEESEESTEDSDEEEQAEVHVINYNSQGMAMKGRYVSQFYYFRFKMQVIRNFAFRLYSTIHSSI